MADTPRSDPDRFRQSLIDTLSKRSGNLCSNPNCKAITTGPTDDDARSITIGEAAHIYGAHFGAARYEATMTTAERSDIANAIWLCRNCHKLVDADPVRFSADILFEWRREHEKEITVRLGRTDDRLRQNLLDRQLIEFKNESYRAQQIVIDRPYAWEYRLTTELVRSKLAPISARWRSLDRRLYAKLGTRIMDDDALDWFMDRGREASSQITALCLIASEEFQHSWGPPGEPGSPSEILQTCNLFVEACERLLHWEEQVRFAKLPPKFERLQQLYIGIGGRALEQVAVIVPEMAQIFDQDNPTGTHHISLAVDVPDGWQEQVEVELERIGNII